MYENGKYNIKCDTVFLDYNEQMNNDWPDRILITKKYFITIPKNNRTDTVKIMRYNGSGLKVGDKLFRQIIFLI